MLLLPDRGIGIFAFANRTYAAPSAAIWDAAVALNKAGHLGSERTVPVSTDLESAYRAAGAIYAAGNLSAHRNLLAMNFFLDRSSDGWVRDLAKLKAQGGDCDTSAPLSATGALLGNFTWHSTHGRIKGSVELAPTRPPFIQEIAFKVITL
jgi:serine-type D-Ala-D-Ala carboxypeptidase/endopeptidase